MAKKAQADRVEKTGDLRKGGGGKKEVCNELRKQSER